MAHIQIDDISPRVTYNVGASTDEFPIPFAFFNTSDIIVTVGINTLTLNTDYTITGTAVDAGFSSGTLTLDTAVSSTTVVIERVLPIERTTDFPNSGPFSIPALNTQFDKIVAIEQQLDARIDDVAADVTDAAALFTTLINVDTTVTLFTTRNAIALANVGAAVPYIRTAGYAAAGDGGDALYKRVVAEPSHAGKVQSLDGAWWEIVGRNSLNVAQFGARVNTAGNDTQAFLDAFGALTTDSSKLTIPPGVYYVTGLQFPVTKTNVTIEAAGAELRLLPGSDTEVLVFGDNSTYCPGVHLKGLVIRGMASDQTAGSNHAGIEVRGVDNILFERLNVFNCRGTGILVTGGTSPARYSTYPIIRNCTVSSNERNNILFYLHAYGGAIEGGVISGAPAGFIGIQIVACDSHAITGVQFDENDSSVNFQNGTWCTISSCNFVNSRSVDIAATVVTDRIAISGNTFNTGNQLSADTFASIVLLDASRCSVTGNTFTGRSVRNATAITEGGAADYNVVTGNVAKASEYITCFVKTGANSVFANNIT